MIKVNHMQEVAEILGVELNTPFKLVRVVNNEHFEPYFRLTQYGLQSLHSDNTWRSNESVFFEELMNGQLAIVGVPQLPRKEEYYYVPDINAGDKYFCCIWYGNEVDMERYHAGLVCRTKNEAVKLAQRMLKLAKECKIHD